MQIFSGRVAFVAGGASARRCGRRAFEDQRRATAAKLRDLPVKD